MMSFRSRILAAAAALLVMPFSAQALPAGATGPDPAPGRFAAEARAAGLTTTQQQELQRAVDAELAKRGGRQVAANKIVWADGGGDTTVAYPAGVQGDWQTCTYGNFCVYSAGYFNGTKHSFYDCRFYPFTDDFFSYVNNQTGHTKAKLHWEQAGGPDITPGAWHIEDWWNGYSYSGITPC